MLRRETRFGLGVPQLGCESPPRIGRGRDTLGEIAVHVIDDLGDRLLVLLRQNSAFPAVLQVRPEPRGLAPRQFAVRQGEQLLLAGVRFFLRATKDEIKHWRMSAISASPVEAILGRSTWRVRGLRLFRDS